MILIDLCDILNLYSLLTTKLSQLSSCNSFPFNCVTHNTIVIFVIDPKICDKNKYTKGFLNWINITLPHTKGMWKINIATLRVEDPKKFFSTFHFTILLTWLIWIFMWNYISLVLILCVQLQTNGRIWYRVLRTLKIKKYIKRLYNNYVIIVVIPPQ